MGFARVGSNPTVVDNFLCTQPRSFQVCPCGAMDSASDFGSGGWGFESPLGLFFLFPSFVLLCFLGSLFPRRCNFGRVVKALALGASLERGMGSNPIACIIFWVGIPLPMKGDVAHSVERSVRNRQAQGSKPCSSIILVPTPTIT